MDLFHAISQSIEQVLTCHWYEGFKAFKYPTTPNTPNDRNGDNSSSQTEGDKGNVNDDETTTSKPGVDGSDEPASRRKSDMQKSTSRSLPPPSSSDEGLGTRESGKAPVQSELRKVGSAFGGRTGKERKERKESFVGERRDSVGSTDG
jgi:hypothetical protein